MSLYHKASLGQHCGTREGKLYVRCEHSLLIFFVKSVLSCRFLLLKDDILRCEVVWSGNGSSFLPLSFVFFLDVVTDDSDFSL